MSQQSIKFDTASAIATYCSHDLISRYYVALMNENEKVNLVSRETSRADFDRLCAESLLPLGIIEGSIGSYLDIGSGGGIPAIPLLLSGRISGRSLLVERTQKKASALGRVVLELGLNAEVTPGNFEELALRRQFDLITLRYVKLTRQLLRKIVSVLAPEGRFVYYSTPEFNIEKISHESYSFQESSESVAKSLTVFSTK